MSKSIRRSIVSNRRRLGVESLENRRLLAGNITATFFGGNLVLRGDAAENAVTISQTSPTTVSVLGSTGSGSATTINGLAGPIVFTGILQSIDADLKGGNDQFLVGNNSTEVNALNNEILFGTAGAFSGAAASRVVVRNSIVFRGGDGIDSAGIFADAGGDIYVDLGANNDGVGVQGSVVKGSVIFEGGTGDQPSLLVRSTTVNNQIIINGGTGANRAVVEKSSVAGLSINTKDGQDNVSVISTNIRNGFSVNTSGGFDSVNLIGSIIGGSANINTGASEDVVTITSASIRYDAIVNLGAGDDNLRLGSFVLGNGLVNQTTIGGVLVIDLGLGNDTAIIGGDGNGATQLRVTGYTTILGGDGNDRVSVINSVFGNGFTADLGAGDDVLDIRAVTIARNLSVFLGAGNDDLLVDTTAAAFAELYGGLGNDGSKLTGNVFGRLIRREFERVIP